MPILLVSFPKLTMGLRSRASQGVASLFPAQPEEPAFSPTGKVIWFYFYFFLFKKNVAEYMRMRELLGMCNPEDPMYLTPRHDGVDYIKTKNHNKFFPTVCIIIPLQSQWEETA